jgi:HEPN domain-containing protein
MPWTEQARLLLRKGEQDAVIVERAITDLEIADEIVGFHVQQAAEKAMKAVLSARGIAYRRTHDLQELHDLLVDNGLALPAEVVEVVAWSPFAVAYRYEDWTDSTPVDRSRGDLLTRATLAWAAVEAGR